MATPRTGAVAYLNARPLTLALDQGLGGLAPLVYDDPAGLVRRMDAGELDLALLPVAAFVGRPDLEIVPGIAIGCEGPVGSVSIRHRVPLAEVGRWAPDPESRTSNLLTEILFARVWRPGADTERFEPPPVSAPIASRGVTTDCPDAAADAADRAHGGGVDAFVQIGDKALDATAPDGWATTDLGGAWHAWTGRPFVFAVWAARPGAVDRSVYRALHDARREGRRQLDWLIADAVDAWDADRTRSGRDRTRREAFLRAYLTESLRYRLGRAEVDALRVFFDEAAALGRIERAPELRFAFGEDSECHSSAVDAPAGTEEIAR